MTFGYFGLSSQSAPWYLIGCAAALPDLLGKCNAIPASNLWLFSLRVPFLIPFSLLAYAACFYFSQKREVATRATFLGIMTGTGIQITFTALPSYQGFGMYVTFLSWFHFSEYFFTETFNSMKVKISSFMLNHSPAYNFALACSIIEFFIERYFYPGLKEISPIVFVGFILCLVGEFIRKRAMYIAGPNFNHLVQYDLQKEPHTLVTYDIYGYVQHPSYTGWFIYTIGTQMILCNPVCVIAFPIAMYRFFEDRVRHEEPALEAKHGVKYMQYKKDTPRFIPYLW